MGKKKGRRQVDPSRDECESTEDEAEEGENLNSCPHTGSESVRTRHVRPLYDRWNENTRGLIINQEEALYFSVLQNKLSLYGTLTIIKM